jgi:hypothetical protein
MAYGETELIAVMNDVLTTLGRSHFRIFQFIACFYLGTLCAEAQNKNDVIVTPSRDQSTFTLVNTSTTHTAKITINTVWLTQKADPATGQTFSLNSNGYPNSLILAPGQRSTLAAPPPAYKDGYSAKKVSSWDSTIEWPYKAREDQKVTDQKKQEEATKARTPAPIGKSPPDGSQLSFQAFLEQLKRSGQNSAYYPGDSHYGPGYYDVRGIYLGKKAPTGTPQSPQTNPYSNSFTPSGLYETPEEPPSPSTANSRSTGASPAAASSYANMLPSAFEGVKNPAWPWKENPATFTKDGVVYLMEPLSPDYQDLTPEQLGIRADPPLYERDATNRALFESYDLSRNKYLNDGLTGSEASDRAWKDSGVDFSRGGASEEAATEIESLCEESTLARISRQLQEEFEAEHKKSIQRDYMNTGQVYLALKKVAVIEADRIQKEYADRGAAVPDREKVLQRAWESIGGNYTTVEEMKHWNATAERLGLNETKNLYKIDEEDTAPKSEKSPEGQAAP